MNISYFITFATAAECSAHEMEWSKKGEAEGLKQINKSTLDTLNGKYLSDNEEEVKQLIKAFEKLLIQTRAAKNAETMKELKAYYRGVGKAYKWAIKTLKEELRKNGD